MLYWHAYLMLKGLTMTVPSLPAEMLAQIGAAATSGQQHLQQWTQTHVTQPLHRLQRESQKWGKQWQATTSHCKLRQRKWLLWGFLCAGIGIFIVLAVIAVTQRKKTKKPALW